MIETIFLLGLVSGLGIVVFVKKFNLWTGTRQEKYNYEHPIIKGKKMTTIVQKRYRDVVDN